MSNSFDTDTYDPGRVRPPASIIIVSYNGRSYLPACLDSLEPAVSQGCELIVVDNGSTDGGPELVENRYPHITLLRNPQNQGFAAACNTGALLAKGAFLVFLNQDTRVEPGWLDGLLAAFADDPLIGLTTSKVLLMSQPELIQLCGQAIHFTGLSFSRGLFAGRDELTMPADVAAVSGASFAIRRALWERLGGFDPAFYMYYEETDLCWRAALLGYHSRYMPESVVYHDFHPARPSAGQLYHSFRNRMLLLLKAWRWPMLLLLLPSLALAEAIEWVIALAYGQMGLRAKLRALAWLLANLRLVVGRRAKAQAARQVPDWTILLRRDAWLAPAVVTGGMAGRLASGAAQLLFTLNRWVALLVGRAIKL